MKKMLSIFLCSTMLLSFASCSEPSEKQSSEKSTEAVTSETTTIVTTKKSEEPTTIKKLTLDKEHTFEDMSLKLPQSVTPSPAIPSDEFTSYYAFFNDKSEMRVIIKKNTSSFTFASLEKETLKLLLDAFASSFAESDNWIQKSDIKETKVDSEYALSQDLHSENQLFKIWHFICGENIYSIGFLGTETNDNSEAISICEDIVKSIKLKKSESKVEDTTINATEPQTAASNITKGQENALKSAKSYVSHSAFSYNELIEQLEFEKYSHDEAVYGADNCGADWTAEALEQAQSYISHSAFSYSELYDQLIYEQFTAEQAQYAVDNCGADWFAEAVEQAESYLSHSSFSRDELYDQLIYEGFTPEQAEHGVSAVY